MSPRTRSVLGWAIVLALFVGVPAAYAYDEPGRKLSHFDGSCTDCHPAGPSACGLCHFGFAAGGGKGPHGLYTTSTSRCACCHEVHASDGPLLLPGATVTASCFTCHDSTGGMGVFGAVAARGLTVGGGHRVDTTNAVPGGDSSTGGTSTIAFGGTGGKLGCDDCHSPHDANTVTAYGHERLRTTDDLLGNPGWPVPTDRLLRKHPAGSVTTVTVYGSDWCLACHAGRTSGGALHNHPADSKATTTTPFSYANAAILASDASTGTTVLGSLAGTNRGYLMPYPRTPQQAGHYPICQQCHEDSRDAGSLDAAGNRGDAATYSVTATDGTVAADNPRFQNFPHETVNRRMTVETDDNLCMNCHPVSALP